MASQLQRHETLLQQRCCCVLMRLQRYGSTRRAVEAQGVVLARLQCACKLRMSAAFSWWQWDAAQNACVVHKTVEQRHYFGGLVAVRMSLMPLRLYYMCPVHWPELQLNETWQRVYTVSRPHSQACTCKTSKVEDMDRLLCQTHKAGDRESSCCINRNKNKYHHQYSPQTRTSSTATLLKLMSFIRVNESQTWRTMRPIVDQQM